MEVCCARSSYDFSDVFTEVQKVTEHEMFPHVELMLRLKGLLLQLWLYVEWPELGRAFLVEKQETADTGWQKKTCWSNTAGQVSVSG